MKIIIMIDQNIKKGPGDFRRLVTQNPVENHHLTLFKKRSNNKNDNNNNKYKTRHDSVEKVNHGKLSQKS